TDQDSFKYARLLTIEEGIFSGGSTGTIVSAMLQVAAELDENAVIVFIVCDTGERYLTKFHSNEWLRDKRLSTNGTKTLKDIIEAKNLGKERELVSVKSEDKIKTAVELLNFRGFSQLPVIDDGISVGSVRESQLMMLVLKDSSLLDSPISKVMEKSLPPIDNKTEISAVKNYLSDSPAILVTEYGRIIDIVTRYDIIEHSDL
ncbi:MAG: CBS domain-containing protein, partial [Bacteroidetes bacterium]|nr:CBS domain-containing protein [Bacteroidota bacterium]